MKPYHTASVPLEAQYLYRRGRELMDQQKEDIALAYLRQALFIAPGFSKAYRDLGNCLARLGRMDEASVYYHKAARIDPVAGGNASGDIALKGQGHDQPVAGAGLAFLVW